MSKGRWIKHNLANVKILEILRKARRHMTTNEIREKLDNNYNFRISWVTLNGYLKTLESSGHISGIKIEKKNTIRIWKYNGEKNAEIKTEA